MLLRNGEEEEEKEAMPSRPPKYEPKDIRSAGFYLGLLIPVT